ncbi:MAG TPA: TlyA family RNA methyltransferase [Candidatus Saccharimonadales bacterium]|nr:TlyA family RNA methyltransferase [Candidatus Saccharimonadales bacterium]
MKTRLDQRLVQEGLVASRSQAESYIKLGQVTVNKKAITKPGFMVNEGDEIKLTAAEQYVSRAGLKLASVAEALSLDFQGKTVLDIGSSTGGFTDYALRHGAREVIAVDVGTNQLHPSLRTDKRVKLHEKTDIRAFQTAAKIDLVLADLSFISLREILPKVAALASKETRLAVMVKPQFEAGQSSLKHKGVIKNDRMRRDILKDFESWVSGQFIILDKADSQVAGSKGNRERFYLLRKG